MDKYNAKKLQEEISQALGFNLRLLVTRKDGIETARIQNSAGEDITDQYIDQLRPILQAHDPTQKTTDQQAREVSDQAKADALARLQASPNQEVQDLLLLIFG